MKRFLWLFSALTMGIVSVCAQQFHIPATGEMMDELVAMEREETIYTPLSQQQLYANAQKWVVDIFGDYKSAVLSESPESGRLIIRGYTNLGNEAMDYNKSFTTEIMFCTVTIECKDEEYQYKIAEIDLQIVQYNVNSGSEVCRHIGTSYNRERAEMLARQLQECLDEIDRLRCSTSNERKFNRESAAGLKRARNIRNEMQLTIDLHYREQTIVADLAESLKKAMTAAGVDL